MDTPLKLALREQGRRHDWLALQVGAEASQVSRWANGVHEPSETYKRKIAEALGLPVESLWPGEPKVAA